MQLDDVPVGGGTKMVDSGASPEEDFSATPVSELLDHQNWKARKAGYDRVQSDPSKLKAEVFSRLKKVSSETNTAVQEAIFEALTALVGWCDDAELELLCEGPLKLAVEKGIVGRPKATQVSEQFISLLIENNKVDTVFAVVLPSLSHKTPKNRMCSAHLCTVLISDFGVEHFPLKSILKALLPLFNDVNGQVRKEAIALCCQCYRYKGDVIKSFLVDLRETQLRELEKQFEAITPGDVPPKKLKGVASSAPATTTGPGAEGAASVSGAGGDMNTDDAAYLLHDETPIISKLPRGFFQKALDKTTVWQDRRAYVNETALPLLSAPRFRAKDDYHELAGMIKQYLVDPQAPLMLLGFKMIQECARGLRDAFGVYARMYITPLFDKLKDKKTSVLEHVMTTLETLIHYHCITLDQCHDDIDLVTQSKNPAQRLSLLNFCVRVVNKLDSGQYNKLSHSMPTLKRMMTDEKVTNREVAYVLLNHFISQFGEAPYKSLISALEEKQRAKMLSVFSRTNSSCNGGSSVVTPKNAGTTPSNSPAKKLLRVEDEQKPAMMPRTRTLSSSGRKPTQVGASLRDTSNEQHKSKSTARHPSAARQPGAGEDAVSLEATMPPKDESFAEMVELLKGDTTAVSLIRSSEWPKRLDGVQKIQTMTELWSAEEAKEHLNALVICFRSYPGFSGSIFQVFNVMVNALCDVAEKASNISAGAGYVMVADCTPRLTDPKNRPPVRRLCSTIAARLSPRFVIRHMMTSASQVNTPKLLQECNEYFFELIQGIEDETQTAALDVKHIVDYLGRMCFVHNNHAVRTSAMQLLVLLRRRVGPSVDTYVAKLSSSVQARYEQELAGNSNGGGKEVATARTAGLPPTYGGGRPTTTMSARPSTMSTSDAPDFNPKRVRTLSQSSRGPGPSSHSATTSPRRTSTLRGTEGRGTQMAVPESSRTSLAASVSSNHAELPTMLKPIVRQISTGEDWRARLDGVRKVEEFISQNGGTLPTTGVQPLLKALNARFSEANKNLVVEVLRVLSVVMEAVEPEVSHEAVRKVLPGVFAMLGDQKTNLREEAQRVAFLGMQVVGLDALLPYLQRPLSSDSALARQAIMDVMIAGFEQLTADAPLSRPGLQLLLPLVIKSLLDRILEVRSSAERTLGCFIPVLGEDPIYRIVQTLKPAEQQSVAAAIERQVERYRQEVDDAEGLSAQALPENEEEEDSHRVGGEPAVPAAHCTSTSLSSFQAFAESDHLATASQRGPAAGPSVSTRPATALPHPNPALSVSALNSASRAEVVKEMAEHADETAGVPLDASPSVNEEKYSIAEIVLGLRSAAAPVAYIMCTDFMKRLRAGEDCGSPEVVQALADRLYDNTKNLEPDLALGLINCLSAVFSSPECARRYNSSLLYRLLGLLFDCLLSEQFSLNETVIKSLNSATLRLLEGCVPNEVFSALLSHLTNYSTKYLRTGRKSELKYLQVTVKCIMRVDLEPVSPDNVILCCHEYLMQHPPSAFRKLDDLPIRTIKTILQSASRRHGAALLGTADKLIGTQNLVTHFIQACLDLTERSRHSKTLHEAQAAEENQQTQRASLSPIPNKSRGSAAQQGGSAVSIAAPAASSPAAQHHADPSGSLSPHVRPTPNAALFSPAGVEPRVEQPQVLSSNFSAGLSGISSGAPVPTASHSASHTPTPTNASAEANKRMGSIFNNIRNHLTSAQGIDELYDYLKAPPAGSDGEEFRYQFNRCSEAFRLYIKRKLERKMTEDSQMPANFRLPEPLRQL